MASEPPILAPLQRVATLFRVLALALGVLAVLLSGQIPDERLLALGLGYGLLTAVLWVTAARISVAGLAYPLAVLDVGAVTALMYLWPGAELPLWMLYLLPQAAAAVIGTGPALTAVLLSTAGVLGLTWLTTSLLTSTTLWTAALILAGGAAVATVASRWLFERRTRQLQAELAAAQAALRREQILRTATSALASTLERQAVCDILVSATREALGASASVVVPSSGHLLAGDRPASQAEGATGKAAFARPLAADLELRVTPGSLPLDATAVAWIGELATAASRALERCARHEELEQDLERLTAIVEHAPAPLVVWDREGSLVLANAAHRELGGSPTPPSTMVGDGRETEVTLGTPPRTFVVATTPVAGGRWIISLYRDVTREREALRAKDELISMAGHELRNPLTSIQGYSQMMARQLHVVQQQAEQLNRLISDFMAAARLEGGQLPLACEPVDLAELARAAAQRFWGAHEGRPLRLDLREVPLVEADPTRIEQVLDNLLENAAKYSPPDREIVLSVTASDTEVLVAVRDQGEGIAPEHLPRLFERFYRAPSAGVRGTRGLGLGLSVVRDLVIAHGGRVWAESDGPGQGSTFWFALPRRPRAAHEERAGVPDGSAQPRPA